MVFGNWATLFHADALTNAGLNYNEVSAIKPYPTNWDGNPTSLTGEAALLGHSSALSATTGRLRWLMVAILTCLRVVQLTLQILTVRFDVRLFQK